MMFRKGLQREWEKSGISKKFSRMVDSFPGERNEDHFLLGSWGEGRKYPQPATGSDFREEALMCTGMYHASLRTNPYTEDLD